MDKQLITLYFCLFAQNLSHSINIQFPLPFRKISTTKTIAWLVVQSLKEKITKRKEKKRENQTEKSTEIRYNINYEYTERPITALLSYFELRFDHKFRKTKTKSYKKRYIDRGDIFTGKL